MSAAGKIVFADLAVSARERLAKSEWRPAWRFAAMLLLFGFLIELGIRIYDASGQLTTVRPVCGVVLALLLLSRGHRTWSLALALSAAEIGLRLYHGQNPVGVLMVATITICSAFVTYWSVRAAIGPDIQFRNWRNLLKLVLIGAGVSLVSSTIFSTGLTLIFDHVNYWKHWQEWFIPTVLSYALFTPLTILAVTTNLAIIRTNIAGFGLALLVLMAVLASLYVNIPIPRMSVIPLVLIVIALKFEVEGLAFALLATEIFMTAGILGGYKLTAMGDVSTAVQLQFTQVFIAMTSFVLLPSAAAITERREFRDSLAEAAERNNLLSRIVESSDDAIFSTARDGRIQSCNRAAAEMFGYQAAELVGRNVSVIFPNARMGERDRILSDLREGAVVQHLETVQHRKDGSEYSISLSISPIRDLNGAIVGSSVIARDVTEKRQRDTKLAALSNQLSHLARVGAIGQMSGAIAHELGQPLAAITNYASVAKQCLNEERVTAEDLSTARDSLTRLGAAAIRAGAIIRGLRDFIEKRPSRAKPDDLNAILQEAIAMTFLGTTGDQVQLKPRITQDAMPVSVDRVQIQQVMHNLMRNSIEAMNNSPVREMFISTGFDGDDYAFFEIRDTGPGVPDAELANLFEPFKTTKADGMGVGLSICKTIIEAHGGTIRAQNSPSGGACFYIRIPLVPAGSGGTLSA